MACSYGLSLDAVFEASGGWIAWREGKERERRRVETHVAHHAVVDVIRVEGPQQIQRGEDALPHGVSNHTKHLQQRGPSVSHHKPISGPRCSLLQHPLATFSRVCAGCGEKSRVGLARQSSHRAWQARCGFDGFQAAQAVVPLPDPRLKPTLACCSALKIEVVESKLPGVRSHLPFISGDAGATDSKIRTAMALKDNLELLFYVVAWYVGNTFYNIVSDRHSDQDGSSRDPVTACTLLAGRRKDSPHLSGARNAHATATLMQNTPMTVQQEGSQHDPRALDCGPGAAHRESSPPPPDGMHPPPTPPCRVCSRALPPPLCLPRALPRPLPCGVHGRSGCRRYTDRDVAHLRDA